MSLFGARARMTGSTQVDIDGRTFGADPEGPLGGGAGYEDRVTLTTPLRSVEALLEALDGARAGDVLFLAGNATFECTELVYVEELVLRIPAAVTLASDRGIDGSPGALLRSDSFATRPLIRALGPDVRLTGLRLQGPNPRRCLEHHQRAFREGGPRHDYYYKFPTSDGVATEFDRLRVDNCELAGWSHSAIRLGGGNDHRLDHNFIHHNQYNGLGYGISHGQAGSLIEANLFNANRHSIAGTGAAGCSYEARHNLEMGTSLSHCFDMHGGRDRKDGTDLAGGDIHIHHNTFRAPRRAIVIRGVPEHEARIEDNWFRQHRLSSVVRHEGNVKIGFNAWGQRQPQLAAS